MPVPAWRRSERIAALAQRHGALAVLLLAVLVASLVFDSFATFDNVTGISIQSSFLVVVALGMTFVIITGGIDLSVGSVFALGGVVAAWASQYGWLPALLAPLLVCGAVGLLNGLLIAYTGLAPFIVTLASLLGARGLLLAITDEGAKTYLVPRDSAFARTRPGHAARLRLPGVDRGAAVRSRRRPAAADPVRSGRVRGRRQRGRGRPDGPAGGPHQGARPTC